MKNKGEAYSARERACIHPTGNLTKDVGVEAREEDAEEVESLNLQKGRRRRTEDSLKSRGRGKRARKDAT
jgi:hypothetical protein